jgi:hypothetical protein
MLTDGILRMRLVAKPKILATLEAKGLGRRVRTEAVIMQETCEHVACLMSQTFKVAIFNHQ